MIQFSHVYKTYPGPTHALRDVNFSVEKGEWVFLRGHSGAGKSTLFRMICAFDQPTSGMVSVGGQSVEQLTAEQIPFFRRRIGVVFQDFKLLKDRTIFENIALPLKILGDREHHIVKAVREMAEKVNLSDKLQEYPQHLSGGEQQRIAVARALIHKPEILIADEPTGNLDIDMAKEIMLLLQQANTQGTTIFVASHDYELIHQFGRRVIELSRGEMMVG